VDDIKEFIQANKGLSFIIALAIVILCVVIYGMLSTEDPGYTSSVNSDISSSKAAPQNDFNVESIVSGADVASLRTQEIKDLSNKTESSRRTVNNLTHQVTNLENQLGVLTEKLTKESSKRNKEDSSAREKERNALLKQLKEMQTQVAQLNSELAKSKKELGSKVAQAVATAEKASKAAQESNVKTPSTSEKAPEKTPTGNLDDLLNFDDPSSNVPPAPRKTDVPAKGGEGDKSSPGLDALLGGGADSSVPGGQQPKIIPKYNYYVLDGEVFKKVAPYEAFSAFNEGVTVYRGVTSDAAAPVTTIDQIKLPKKFYRLGKDGKLVEIIDPKELARLVNGGKKIVTMDSGEIRDATASEIKSAPKIDTSHYRVFVLDKKTGVRWISDDEAQKLVLSGKIVNVKLSDGSIRSISDLDALLLAFAPRDENYNVGLLSGHVNSKTPRLFAENVQQLAADRPFSPGGGFGDSKPNLEEITEEIAYRVLGKGKPVTVVFSDKSRAEQPVVIVTTADELKSIMDNYRGLGSDGMSMGMFNGQISPVKYAPKPTYDPKEGKDKAKFIPVPVIPLASEVYARIEDSILAPLPPLNLGGQSGSGSGSSTDLSYPVKITFIGDVVNDKATGKISLDSCQAMGLASGTITENPTFLTPATARAKIIITSISCINANNEVIEQSLPASASTGGIAYVVDTFDNQPEVHGYYFSDEDYRALDSIPTNIVSGIGEAFATAGTTQTSVTGQPAAGTSGTSTVISTPTGGELKRGIGTGVNKSIQDYIAMKAARGNQVERVVYSPAGAIIKVIFNRSVELPGLIEEVQ